MMDQAKIRQWAATALALAAFAGLAYWALSPSGPKVDGVADAQDSPWFTGKEEKAPVKLYFVDRDKAGFVAEQGEIYLTRSTVARVKQVLKQFFAGPKDSALASAFGPQAAAREVFLDAQGLCVVDLTGVTASGHPGGTTAEYQSLYALFRTLRENFPGITAVQILVEGERVESLAGHLDIMDPLTRDYF